jgi:hypothetical protein
MRNVSFIIALIGSFSIGHCQIFKGTVYDRATDSVLCGAVIYISGTSVGTSSDIHGNFRLDISKYRSMPITISLLGYYSLTLPEHGGNKTYPIYLSPKVNEINEVVIKAKKGKWNTYLRIFKREFLGESENASDCEILNERQLRFIYNTDSSVLRAFSSEPILIYNKALGYSITYYLDKFRYSRKMDEKKVLTENFALLGNYLFKDELVTLNESEKINVLEKRKKAFLGSRMHFFRLLYEENLSQAGKKAVLLSDNTLLSSGYSITSNSPIKADSLVTTKDSISAYLKHLGELYVRHRIKDSILDLKMDSIYFQKNGYFDPLEISFSGQMSKQRIGDLLPFEYVLK